MDATDCSVLLTADFEHPDFAELTKWLASSAQFKLSVAPLEHPPAASHDVLVICQSRPGQFSQAQVEQLARTAPLASLLAVLGSWCEGELRSGRPWHGVERVYWYEAIGRLDWISRHLRQGSRTQTIAERIEQQIKRLPAAVRRTTAAIVTQRRGEFAALADLCQVLGMTPRWQRGWLEAGHEQPEVALLCIDDVAAIGSAETIRPLRQVWPSAKFIALLNFPRRDEIAVLRAAGCNAVLGKPLLVSDLLSSMGELLADDAMQQAAG
jgi:hypothetical protein